MSSNDDKRNISSRLAALQDTDRHSPPGRTVVSRSASVIVAAGAIASVTVEFDTGIR